MHRSIDRVVGDGPWLWVAGQEAALRCGSRPVGQPLGMNRGARGGPAVWITALEWSNSSAWIQGVKGGRSAWIMVRGRPFDMDRGPECAPSGMNRGPTRSLSASIAARVRPLLYGSLARRLSLSAWIAGSEGNHFGADRRSGGNP